jgi:hypothetical protein
VNGREIDTEVAAVDHSAFAEHRYRQVVNTVIPVLGAAEAGPGPRAAGGELGGK